MQVLPSLAFAALRPWSRERPSPRAFGVALALLVLALPGAAAGREPPPGSGAAAGRAPPSGSTAAAGRRPPSGPAAPDPFIEGALIDVLGRPLKGVTVSRACEGKVTLLATTGADGHFRIRRPEGNCQTLFRREGLATRELLLAWRERSRPVDLHGLVLSRGFTVRGCLTLDGLPGAGFQVVGVGDDWSAAGWGGRRTGPDGCFAIPHVAEGEHELRVYSPEADQVIPVRVAGRDPPPLRVALHRKATLEVQVLTEAGLPVTEAEVICRDPVAGQVGYADVEGRYTYFDEPGNLVVEVRAPGHLSRRVPVMIGPGERREVRVVLETLAPVPVRVIAATGAPPPAGTKVEATRPDDFFRRDSAVTDADGVAVLRTLGPGHWVLRAEGVPGALDLHVPERAGPEQTGAVDGDRSQAQHAAEERPSQAQHAAEEGPSQAQHGEPVLLDGRADHVSGRVLTAQGRPVAGAVVCLEGDLHGWTCRTGVRTDAEGRFRLEGVAPGDHKLHTQLPGRRFASERAATGRSEIELVFP